MAAFSISRTGVLAYGPGQVPTQLQWMDRRGETLTRVGPTGEYLHPRLSPDETKIAVARLDVQLSTYDLWLIDGSRGDTMSRFTYEGVSDRYPVWSPDGRSHRLFGASDRRALQIFVRPVGGTSDERVLVANTGSDRVASFAMDWASDGTHLVFSAQRANTNWDIDVADVATGEATTFLSTPFIEVEPQLSSDRRWLAYTSDESGNLEVYVRSFPAGDGKWQVSTAGGRQPRWRSDHQELFYQAPDGTLMAVPVTGGFDLHRPPPHCPVQDVGTRPGAAVRSRLRSQPRRPALPGELGVGTARARDRGGELERRPPAPGQRALMAPNLSGQIAAFFLFDVAEGADLAAVRALLGSAGQSVRLAPRPVLPAYVQYLHAPVQADADAMGLPKVEGWSSRLKVYDYGVVSLSLTRPFSGSWADLTALSQTLLTTAPLEASAEACCRQAVARLGSALQQPRDAYLSEDYFVLRHHLARGQSIGRGTRGCSRRRHRPAAARRGRAAQHAGARRGVAAPPLLPRHRPRGPDVERRVRLRHRGRAARRSRDSRVRQLAAAAVPLLRPAARPRAGRRSMHGCRPPGGTSRGSAGATPPPRASCTASSSTSTSSPTAPRTR